MFELGDPPDYEPDAGVEHRGPRASARAATALDLAYDLLLGDGGRAFLYLPFLNYADGNLDAVGEMLAHPNTVVGLGDGGAHVGTICDASFPTTLLTLWVRDRDHGRLDLPFAVQRHTSATARTVGLLDRGVLAPGYRADVNVIDFERLTARRPEMRHDLPAGGKRLVQSADGYVATLVAGEVTYENGEAERSAPGSPRARPATRARRTERPDEGIRASSRSSRRASGGATTLGDSYVFQLTDAHLAELDAALVHAEERTDDVLDITRESFPLPDARSGAGTASPASSSTGAGSCSSAACPSSATARSARRRSTGASARTSGSRGRRTRRVTCSVTSPTRARPRPTRRRAATRSAASRSRSTPTAPTSSGLFCLDAGASGGASLVANVGHDPQRARPHRAELAAELYAPFPYDLRGEQAPGAKPWYTMPIFNRRGDRLFVRYIRPYIEASRRHEDAPRPSDAAREAMNRVDAMCADPQYHVSMTMQPGDMQFVNNYHVLHARDAYEDDRPAGRIRHLKRLWLETEVLADDEKPERFRLGRTDSYWASKGRTKSELNV